MDLEDIAVLSLVIGCLGLVASVIKPSPRRWWVRPWILKRDERGTFRLVNEEFEAANDSESYINFLRMDKDAFEKLLSKVEQNIQKQSTHLRLAVSARNRLIITLRFLATGESFTSLHYSFSIGKSTIASIISEVCQAIYNQHKRDYLKVPRTASEWLNISKDFMKKWDLPNTLGAIDGKHIVFRAPLADGSAYYNYKNQNSIVLLAVVDANYKFTYIDCGTNGRVSDGGVFQKSSLFTAMENNLLNFPQECPLPGRLNPVPLVFVADAAFPLKRNIIKPFPFKNMSWAQRIFNYRLSRARRVVENAFGILANKWRVLLSPINLNADKVQFITQTCCALHNFLLQECPKPKNDEENEFKFIFGLSQQGGNRPRQEALDIRNEFVDYVNNEGAVHWQNNLA